MLRMRPKSVLDALALGLCASFANVVAAGDPLPSWNDTVAKKAIIAFVEKVAKDSSPDFVPPNDETLGTCKIRARR